MKNLLTAAAIAVSLCFAANAQSISISSKKITYTRKNPISDYKKTFTIQYPKVKASTPALSRKIENAISFSSVLGLDLKEELGEYQWLADADYEVKYNENGILSIELRMTGSGAYPSDTSKIIVVDTKKGIRVTPTAVFRNLAGLAGLVDKSLKKEIAKAIIEIRSDKENEEPNPATLFVDSRFRVGDLDGFSIDQKGVTFKFDYGFPHVIKALEPQGVFSFTWRELRPFIRPDGLLARFLR